jgi:hypothetical protein
MQNQTANHCRIPRNKNITELENNVPLGQENIETEKDEVMDGDG